MLLAPHFSFAACCFRLQDQFDLSSGIQLPEGTTQHQPSNCEARGSKVPETITRRRSKTRTIEAFSLISHKHPNSDVLNSAASNWEPSSEAALGLGHATRPMLLRLTTNESLKHA